jgi:hypothetical protein
MVTKELREEYDFVAGQFRAVWQTFASAFSIAVSGILIGLIMAADKYPSSGPIFVIFPLIIVGWYVMMDLQGKELASRGQYLALIEERIRKETGQAFPCAESKILPLIYSSWRYGVLVCLVSTPVLLVYSYSAVKAIDYIQLKFPKYCTGALAVYIIFPILSLLLAYLSGRAINKELVKIKADLAKSKKNVQ